MPRYAGRTGHEQNLILVVFAQVDAKTKKARPAAAAAAANLAAGTTDELDDYKRRVEIVAMLLDLNAEATTLDPSVKKLLPADARLYGGLGGLEGNMRSGMQKKARNAIAHQVPERPTPERPPPALTMCRRRRRRSQDCREEWTKAPKQRRVCKRSNVARARSRNYTNN